MVGELLGNSEAQFPHVFYWDNNGHFLRLDAPSMEASRREELVCFVLFS